MKIKKINKNDLKDFTRLWNQGYKALTSSQFKMTLTKAKDGFKKRMFEYFGIYEENNQLLGFLLLQTKNKTLWLKHILIDKNFRKKGAGQKLLGKTIKMAKKRSKKLKTEVLKENTKARKFFIKNGFKIIKFDKKEKQYILEKNVG